MIQDCPKPKNKEEYLKISNCVNRNGTCNTLNMNIEITQAAIAAFYTSHTNDNSIPVQVKMARIVRQILVNTVATNKDFSVTVLGISKRFYIQYDNNASISIMVISKITTRNRHVSSNNSTKHDSEIGYNSTIEIDSHVDNYFCFNNFRIVSTT